ncbi:MAG: phytoene desaturase family protein, partial [Candidatus Dormibacteria bacterium]
DETGLRRFIGVMRALGEATDRLVTPSSNWRIPGMVVRAGPSAWWAMQPLARLLDACRLSVGARAVLTAQASYLTSPHRAATLVHAAFLHNYIRDGAYFPAGGGQVLAAHLASVVTAHGGQVRTRARVSRIVVQSNRVTGVELTSGERIAADVVVSNADIKRTLLELVGPDHVPSRLLRRTENYRMSVPLVNLYIALDVDLRDQIPNTNYFSCPVTEPSEVVFDMGQRAGEMSEPEIDDYLSRVPAYVTFQSIKDPDNDMIAPQGYTNLEIMSGAPSDYRFWGVETGPYAGGRYRRRPDYLYRKEQYTDALLDRGAAVVPGVARQTG